jgi:hypothetical protein
VFLFRCPGCAARRCASLRLMSTYEEDRVTAILPARTPGCQERVPCESRKGPAGGLSGPGRSSRGPAMVWPGTHPRGWRDRLCAGRLQRKSEYPQSGLSSCGWGGRGV